MPLSQADLQNCLQIIEKPVFTTPSACMLLTLPQNIAAKAYNTISLPDIITIRRKRKNGHEKQLDLNEVETEEMDLLMNKEMMKEHYRIQEEVDAIEQCICDNCGKAIAEKAIHCYEERNGYSLLLCMILENKHFIKTIVVFIVQLNQEQLDFDFVLFLPNPTLSFFPPKLHLLLSPIGLRLFS